MKTTTLLFVIIFIAGSLFAQTSEKRIALVIGNSAYPGGSALKKPVNDANLMARTLTALDFTVIKRTNATKAQLERAIYEYSRKLKDYDVALFYYAGHGIQVDGKNFLVPIDAKLSDKTAVKFEAVAVNFVVDEFENYQNNTNIVILDACRDNPFRSWGRGQGQSRGFKAIPPASGTIIAFATSEGSTAADGTGANGLYTTHLVKQLKIGQSIESVFKKTRIAVQTASGGKQSPQEWTKRKYKNKHRNSRKFLSRRKKLGYLNANTRRTRDKITTGRHSYKIVGSDETKTGTITVYQDQTANIEIKSTKKPKGTFILNADFTVPAVGMSIKMRGIQGGTFTMGGSDSDAQGDETPHTVKVSNFAMMKYEVTIEEYMKFAMQQTAITRNG